MIPLWLMIAQGVKTVADNQNKQIDEFNRNQQYMTGNGNSTGLGNALSTFSSIYSKYLDDDAAKNLFQRK